MGDVLAKTIEESKETRPREPVLPGFAALRGVTRTTPASILLLGYVAISLLMAPLNLSHRLLETVYSPVYRLSHGLVFPNLLVGLLGLVATWVFIGWPAKLSPSEFGWRRSGFKSGLLAVLLLWGILQGTALMSVLISGEGLSLHAIWRTGNYSGIGRFVGQLFGTAPFEESLFRGILPVQVFFILKKRRPGHARRWICLAMLISALAFALPHIPNRIVNESYSGIGSILLDQVELTLVALLFTWVYLSTGNLFLLIGVHALINAPTALLASPLDGNYQLILVFGILALWLVPRVRRPMVSWVQPRL